MEGIGGAAMEGIGGAAMEGIGGAAMEGIGGRAPPGVAPGGPLGGGAAALLRGLAIMRVYSPGPADFGGGGAGSTKGGATAAGGTEAPGGKGSWNARGNSPPLRPSGWMDGAFAGVAAGSTCSAESGLGGL